MKSVRRNWRAASCSAWATAAPLRQIVNPAALLNVLPPFCRLQNWFALLAPSRLSQYATLHALFPHPLTKSATNKTHSPQSYGAL